MSKFEVDAKGFAVLQAGRDPWTLAREPISNSFDEATVTRVNVELTKDGNKPAVYVVEDDGPGFADLKDAYTLYADTYKRSNPRTRGRFNRGEKELLSLAIRGSIITTSGSVRFEGDERIMGRKKLDRGTRVEVEMRWTKAEVAEIVARLHGFLPPRGIVYSVNGVVVPPKEPDYKVPALLETVIKEGDAMRTVARETEVHVHRTSGGILMEMGVPIMRLVELSVPFVLDVQQKVPLSPERDSVRTAYLQDVLAEVLNAVADDLTEDESNERWVNLALPNYRVTSETVRKVKEKRIGNALILNPFDALANERAIRAGLELVSTRGWDPAVVDRFKEDAGWTTTSQAFPAPTPAEGEVVDETPGMVRTRKFIEAISRLVKLRTNPSVRFVNLPHAWAAADCSTTGTITFYVNRTGKAFFDRPTEDLLYLVVHELAHIGPSDGNPYAEHDESWYERMGKCLAKIALNWDSVRVFLWGDVPSLSEVRFP